MNQSAFLELLSDIDEQLVSDGHSKVRFAFVVWNTDGTNPAFSGSNDPDMTRALAMMARAREFILAVENTHSEPLN